MADDKKEWPERTTADFATERMFVTGAPEGVPDDHTAGPGHIVRTAMPAQQRARIEAEIGAVITDMMMPAMSGVATINALLQVNASVRIIVLTGLATEAQKEAAMAAGGSEFLAKPFSIERLIETLNTFPP